MTIRNGSIVIVKYFKYTKRHFGIDEYDARNMIGKEFRVKQHDHDSVYINDYYIHKKDIILKKDVIEIESKPFHFNTESLVL